MKSLSKRWAHLPLRTKGLMVVAIPLASVIAASGLFFLEVRRGDRTHAMLQRAVELRSETQMVSNLLMDAETGTRGYLLTGRKGLLEPRDRALRELPSELARLERMTRGDTGLAQRARALAALSRRRLRILDRLLELPEARRPISAPQQRLLIEGERLDDELRRELAAMRVAEEATLAQRRASVDRSQVRGIAAVIGSAVVGLLAGFLAMVLFTSGIVRRSERLAHNARRLSRGEALQPMPPGNDEMGLLGRGLEDAALLLSTRSKDLRVARSFLEHLITASPVIILRARSPLVPTVIDYVSPNVGRLLGYDVESIIGTEEFWGDHVHPEERSSFDAVKEHALEQDQNSFEFEGRFLHGDGSWVWIHHLAHIEYNESGDPLSCLAYVTDITDRKVAEEATRAAQALAERSNLAKSEFLSRMSHELRTPLHAILGFAQLLEMDDLGAEQRTSVRQVLNGGRHLLQLIDEVLDIARIEEARISLSVESVNVDEVIEEALDLIRPFAMAHQISLDETTRTGLCVAADRQKLKQVLLNLLSNGVKYNRSGGHVKLQALVLTEQARITVEDTGMGVPGHKLDQVFEPFDRLGAERSEIEGTGLGLALCKALMEAMGGRIGLESEPGEGSRFWIELPLSILEAQHQDQLVEPWRPSAAVGGRKTVLYIEDNLPNLNLVERILATRPHIELLVATEGETGIELAVKHRPDVVLLDLNLPDIHGAEVLKRLKGEASTNEIRVVVLSADATSARADRLLREGANAYLSKPLDVHRFLGILDKELECPT